MRTGKLLVINLLAAAFLGGCSNMEEPVAEGTGEEIRVSAGITEATRAVIGGGYAEDLEISFARMDNPKASSPWNEAAIDAVRTGGTGNTAITFDPEQNYLTENKSSALIGYYPRKALDNGTVNPVTVSYTITGDDDLMATEIQTGALNAPFESFTFRHLLTQMQFRCTGSAGAILKWTKITSVTVKGIATGLTLSLDKTSGAILRASGSTDRTLAVKGCPSAVSAADAENPPTGYLMLFPVADMGTEKSAIDLEVKATYNGEEKTLAVAVSNIEEGVKAGQSHLVTLTFTEDGRIEAAAGIAAWQPGNSGSSVVTPGE